MDEATFTAVANAAGEAYSKRVPPGKGFSFDPASLIAIITAIMQAVTTLCPKPQNAGDIKKAAQNPSPYHRFMVTNQTRRELRDRYGFGGYAKHNGDAVVETIFDLGKNQPEDHIAAVCGCAN